MGITQPFRTTTTFISSYQQSSCLPTFPTDLPTRRDRVHPTPLSPLYPALSRTRPQRASRTSCPMQSMTPVATHIPVRSATQLASQSYLRLCKRVSQRRLRKLSLTSSMTLLVPSSATDLLESKQSA